MTQPDKLMVDQVTIAINDEWLLYEPCLPILIRSPII